MKIHSLEKVTVTVDLALFRMTSTGLEVLLIRRGNLPYQSKLALPGGKLNADDPSLEQALLREVREETGLTVPAKYLRQVGTYGNVGRDPRGRTVSVLYTLTELVPESFVARAGDDASAVAWVTPITDRPELAFDHEQMLEDALPPIPDCPALAFDHRTLIEDALQFQYNWRRLTSPGTQRLNTPRQCEIGSEFGERCPLPAHWQVNGWAMCEEDIKTLANMNSDNEDLVRPALATMQRPWA